MNPPHCRGMCVPPDESKRTKQYLSLTGGVPTADTTMAQAKDYSQKIAFWQQQLALASNEHTAHLTRYSEERCEDSLRYFRNRQEEVQPQAPALSWKLEDEDYGLQAEATIALRKIMERKAEVDPRWNRIHDNFDLMDVMESYIANL